MCVCVSVLSVFCFLSVVFFFLRICVCNFELIAFHLYLVSYALLLTNFIFHPNPVTSNLQP